MNFLADDAFYVTLPAKHLAGEAGFPSLDGTNPTNGFHPAIFGIDYILAKVGLDDIYIANMWIGLAGMILTALLYNRYTTRLGNSNGEDWAAMALVANPFLLASSMAGLESTLFTMAIVFYYGRLYKMVDDWFSGHKQPWQSWLAQGFLGVLAYLCRTEFLFHMLGHALAFFILLLVGIRSGRKQDCIQCFVPWLLLVVPPTIAFYCYGKLGEAMTGHFTQSSASQKSVIHQIAAGDFGAIDPLRFYADFQHHGLLPLLLMLAPVLYHAKHLSRLRPGLLFILCSTFAILFFYSLLIPIYQWHYMASYVVMVSLATPLFFKQIIGDSAHGIPGTFKFWVVGGATAMVAWVYIHDKDDFYNFRNLDLVFAIAYAASWFFPAPQETAMGRLHFRALAIAGVLASLTMVWFGESFRTIHYYRSDISTTLREILPPDMKAGVAAAGIYAKFLDPAHRRVVNLDGAISWPALEAIREGRLESFIDEQGIDILFESSPVRGFIQTKHPFIQVREGHQDLVDKINEKYKKGE